MTDRVIYVVGVPNGGTSCVAGILHHLGVDMGEVESEPHARSYLTFEDRRFAEYKAPRFREYLEIRLENAKGRRVGVKCAAWAWMDDPEPETLPIDVLIVRRPLEDSMRSSMRLWTEDRAEQLAEQGNPRKFIMDKVAGVGRAFAAVEMLDGLAVQDDADGTYIAFCVGAIEFPACIEDLRQEIEHLNFAWDLRATQTQMDAALLSVDSSKVHFA